MPLGQLEQSVMDLLWDNSGQLTANDVRELLIAKTPDAPEPAVTTVLTVLSRLTKKGFATKEGKHRPHTFSAVRSREDHTVELLNEVLGSVPDREAVLARFIGGITSRESAAVRALLVPGEHAAN